MQDALVRGCPAAGYSLGGRRLVVERAQHEQRPSKPADEAAPRSARVDRGKRKGVFMN